MKKKSYLLFVGFFVMTVLFLSTALAQTINEPVKSGERNLQVNSFTRESIAATASPGIQSGNRSENVLPVNGNESACCAITRITGRHSMTLIPEELAHVFEQTRSSVHVQYPKAPTDDASILLVATTQVGGSVQQALSELGYTYDYTYSENDWTGINFSPYDVVIIAMDGGLVGAPSLLKIRTDVIDAGKRVIFIGGTCYQPFAAGVNQYLVQNNVNNYCWSISAQLQFTVTQPAHDLAQGLASPWNFVNNSAGYYALRATDPDIDVVAQNGDNWPILFYKGDNWPNVKGNNAKGGGDLIWFTNTANEGYWSNPSDFALLKQMISNSILYTSSCFETVLLISTTAVDNSVKKALNELDYTYSDIFSSDWTGIDFSPYDVVIIAMDGGSVGESSLLKIRTDVIDAGKRVIFIGGTCNQPFATGVNQYLVQNNVNNYCWSISPTPQLTVVQPGHWLAEDVPSPYNFANNSTGYYALRANDPDIDIVAMNGDNWPNLFYKNGNWPGSKDNKAKAVGDLIWFTNTAADNYWSNPSDFTLLKQVIENCLSCASPCNNPSDGGAIAASQTICTNTSPDPLIQTVAPGGNPVGTLEYKWQSAANGTDFYDIQPPAASEGYSPPALAATTWYKRLVKVDCETEWVESNVVEVTVEEELSLSCPEPITVNNDEGACGASVEFAATAVGTPTPTLTYTLDGTEISSPHLFDVGTHTVVVTAENDCGLLDCSFTVTVNDNEPPTITCPEDITVNNDEGLCGAVVSYDNPVASDNCGGSVTNPLIYFTATFEGKIYSANADGSGTPTLLYDPDDGIPIFGPVGIEADLGSGTLYWGGGNHGNIYKAPEDGMGTVTTIPSTNGCCEHHDLEIDLINGKIYFTLAGIGLAVANLDGSGTATSLTTTYATSMALDRTNNRIYFAYPDFYGINVINTNGTGEVSNFIAAGDQVRGITIDEAAGRLYWADMGEGKIYTAKADGTETPYILYDDGATGNVYGIDYDAANGLLYWTVFNNSSGIDYIIVAPANGSGTPTVLYTGSYGSIRGIASGRNIHGMTGGAGTPVSVVCTPPSGSLFPVGTTTVECVATDA
ncbi:MAG: hypothetical protein IH598_06290, partial [Bacteroidales bacterium]|nr:hypothetical protein [Bacteroidales bacterium]